MSTVRRTTESMRPRPGRAAMGMGLAALLGLAFVVATPEAVQAQGSNGDAGVASTPVYEREVFEYPWAGRRNPFRPLNAGERLGPRFEDLELNGVLFNPEIGSIATFTDRKTNRRYRVRNGDRLGEVRVARIAPDAVTVVVTVYGISRQEVLRVKKDKEREG
jgi:hypothetical protein